MLMLAAYMALEQICSGQSRYRDKYGQWSGQGCWKSWRKKTDLDSQWYCKELERSVLLRTKYKKVNSRE